MMDDINTHSNQDEKYNLNFNINSNSSININKLVDLMISVGKTENNLMLQRYYFELIEIERNPIMLTEIIFSFLTGSGTANTDKNLGELSEKEQKCLLIYVKNWFFKLGQITIAENLNNLPETILQIMGVFFSDKIHLSNKSIFEEIFKALFQLLKINKEMNTQKITQFITSINNDLFSEIFHNSKGMSYSKVGEILMLIETLAVFNAEIARNSFELNGYYNFLDNILSCFNMFNYGNEEDLIKNKVSLLNKLVGVFCKISTKILNFTFKKETIKNFSLIQETTNEMSSNNNSSETFFSNEIFLNFITKVMKIQQNLEIANSNFNPLSLSIQVFIIDQSDISNPIAGINSAKSNLIDLLTNIIEFLIFKNTYSNYQLFKQYNKLLLEELIKSLGEFYKTDYSNSNNNNPMFIEKSDNKGEEMIILKYITRIIDYITIMIEVSEGSENIFLQNKAEIFRFIIIPGLKITPLERETFLIDAEEFMNSVSDMTDKKETLQPKHRLVRLVDMMSEFIDSVLKFATELYMDILIYVISKSRQNFTPVYTLFTSKNEYISGLFSEYLPTVPDEDLLDQAVTVLASLSYIIYDKPKLNTFVEEKLETINHILINIQDELIKAKLCNFYGYFLDDMFHDHKNILSKSFEDSLHFMFNCLLTENKHISLNFVALDSIHSLVFSDDMKLVITDIVKLYIKDVLSLINNNYFKELTNHLIFHKFIKLLINTFYREIEGNILYVFAYFWRDVRTELEEIIKAHGNNNYTDNNNSALKERNFKLLENLHNIKSLISTCISRGNIIENKSQIYNELLQILPHLDKLLNYQYEEDILQILALVLNDLKLVPSVYTDTIGLIIAKLSNHFTVKFENYHIGFIFTFLKNLRKENYIGYKDKIYELISKRLIFIEKATSVMKIINDHINLSTFMNVFLMFYWAELDTDINEYFKYLNLITRRLSLQPIADENLVGKLLHNFYLVVIRLDSLQMLRELKSFDSLELLLIKTITFPSAESSAEENSISAIFASKMIYFLYTEYFDSVNNYQDEFQDHSITNFIKSLINFNIDQLLYLRKASADKKKRNGNHAEYSDYHDFSVTKKNDMLEDDEEREDGFEGEDEGEHNKINKIAENKNSQKIEKFEKLEKIYTKYMEKKKTKDEEFLNSNFSDESINDEVGSDSDECDSDSEEDLVREILNKDNEDDDDKDDDFLKVKKVKKEEFHKYLDEHGSSILKTLLSNTNEFQIFDEVMTYIANNSFKIYIHLTSSLTKTKLQLMETIRKYKKILPNNSTSGSVTTLSTPKFRKIIKIKRK